MSSAPVTELDLISALQAVGALNKLDESSVSSYESKSTLNDLSVETISNASSDYFPVLDRSESLRIIHNLVEGLLRVQTRDSSTAPRHLNAVLSSLLRFLSDSNSDVRIAADEGLNKLIKFLRSSMSHLILFELFMELKRNHNPRSVSVAMSKFAALSSQIRTTKRRFYAVNLLPTFISICEQENDLLYENLIDSFGQIANELFYYATEKELRSFLRTQFKRLSSNKALIRRTIAQLLVITCQSSRVPLTLLRYLLHLILAEMESLSVVSSTEPVKVDYDSSTPNNFITYWTGLFNTIRYLSIGWEQLSNNITKNSSYLNLNLPSTSSIDLKFLNNIHSRISGTADPESPEMPNPADDSTVLQSSQLAKDTMESSRKLPMHKINYSELDNQMWSKTFFLCLHHACNQSNLNSLMLQTAALEAFVQLLTVRRPLFLYPFNWLTNIITSTSSSTTSSRSSSSIHQSFHSDKTSSEVQGDKTVNKSPSSSVTPHFLNKSELSIDTSIHKESYDVVPNDYLLRTLSSESINTKSPSSDFQSVDSRDTFLIRSVSSSSLSSSLKMDSNEMTSNEQEIRNQLSVVRAKLAKDEEKLANNGGNSDVFSDLGYDIIDDSVGNIQSAQIDDSLDSPNGNESIHDTKRTPVHQTKISLLNLADLINCLTNHNESISLAQIDWLLPFLLLSFDMMPKNMTNQYEWPKPSTMPRTSLHLLVINCLTNLAQLNPFIFFTQLNVNQCCSNDQQFNLEQWQWPTAVDVILEFHNNSTDPQVQGQICILIGNLIGASLVWQSVNYSETNSTLNDEDASPHRSKQSNLERLFSQLEVYLNPSISGIAFRWALSGLRACSSALLSCCTNCSTSSSSSLSSSSSVLCPNEFNPLFDRRLLLYRFLKILASLIVHTSRHSYRLVRRELLNLIIELDWATISYLEETLKTCNFEKSVWFAVKPVRLIDLAWTECWRILCDADPDLREQASVGLIALCSNLTSGIGDYLGISTGDLLPNRVNRSLQFWFPQSYSQSKLGISCFGLVGCLGAYSLPPCLSTLPMEMDVGPVGQQFYQSKMSQLLHLEAENNSNNNYNNNNRTAKQMNCFHSNSTGAIRLFRNCLTALMELPCSSVLPEDRYMLLGVVSCLNQLIGFAHLLSYSDIWFDSSSPPPPSSSSSDSKPLIGDQMEHSVQSTQRRSRLSLLSWHCLTLLSSTPITSTDIELQSALLHLCTGCVIRWSIFTSLDKSTRKHDINTTDNSNESNLSNYQKPFTRFALAYMQHLMRTCCVMWHVFEGIPLPQNNQSDSVISKIPIGSMYSGISESFMHTVANIAQTSTNFSLNKNNQDSVSVSATLGNSGNTDSTSKKRNYGTKLGGSLRRHLSVPRYSPTFSTSNLGYFANMPHYVALYKTLKTAYKTFKISSDLNGVQDRLMCLLQTCLYSFGRLLENLQFNDIAPYADELLMYLTSFYNWQPGACLELATQLLRAFVGTNLCNQWDDQLSRLYSEALNRTSFIQAGKDEVENRGRHSVKNTVDCCIDKLLEQNKAITNYLLDQNVLDENKLCWITIPELHQAPISAWIRFARQRRIPIGLEYANSTDRALATSSAQTMTMSALKIKSDVQSFFKRLEHIVLRGMENYKWTNNYSLQTGILDLLIHLIYLRMNYCQLDVQQKFLHTVISHCENLASEIQRIETIALMTSNSLYHYHHHQQTGKGGGGQQLNSQKRSLLLSSFSSVSISRSECYNSDSCLFPMINLREPSTIHQHQRLVNAIFRFLVTLTYQHRVISSTTTTTPSSASTPSVSSTTTTSVQSKQNDSMNSESSTASTVTGTTTNTGTTTTAATTTTTNNNENEEVVNSRLVELSQVVHLAETLAAETRDPSSVVLTAMIPMIVDLFVIQQPLNQRMHKQTQNIDANKKHQIQQANAQRETIFHFLLRRLSHLPACYDQISLILEEVNISKKLCTQENVIPLVDSITQISNHILSHFTAGTAQIDNSTDYEALQRLFNHLLMIIHSFTENESSSIIWNIISKVEEVLYCEFNPKIFLDYYNITHFIRWIMTKVICSRFIFHLLNHGMKLTQPAEYNVTKQTAKLFEHSLVVFQQIIEGIQFYILHEPFSIGQLINLQFDYSRKSMNLALLIQLSLSHLLCLTELVKSDIWRNIQWDIQATVSVIQDIHKNIYTLGRYEPLLCILWYQLIYSKEVNFIETLRKSNSSDEYENASSGIFLPDYFDDLLGISINSELVSQALIIYYTQSQLDNKVDTGVILQQLLSPSSSTSYEKSTTRRTKIIQIIKMWYSGEPVICTLMSLLLNSKSGFQQLHSVCMENLTFMSLGQINFLLNNMFNTIHSESLSSQLDALFNIFISPQCKSIKSDQQKHCTTCVKSIMPISLRMIASNKACNILQWILKKHKNADSEPLISNHDLENYRLRLTSSGNTLKSDRLLSLLGQLIQYTSEKPCQNEMPKCSTSLAHNNIESILKKADETNWLLNSAKDLLKHCDLSGTLNGIQLIHALSECTTISEKKISNILNSSCLRCSPRMLYYALVCGSSSTSTSTSTLSSSMSTPTSSTPDITNLLSKPGPKTSRITPCVNVLFQVAEKLLFKNIQDIVTNPMELFKETEDPTLVDSVQSYLTGLSFALLEFLRVLPHLPAIDLVPIEKETDALSFLLILIEFFFYSLGYPYTQLTGVTPSAGSSHNSSSSGACAGGGDGDDIRTQPQNMTTDNNYHYMPTRQFMVSVTLIENSLRLLNYVLQTASNRSAKGVDLFGGDGKKFLSIFLTFLWMIDKSACLSEYSTLWSTSINEYMIKAVNNILHNSIQHSPTTLSTLELSTTILLNNLLIPVYPPVMGIWWPDPLSASTLSHFCATIASSASLTAFNSTLPQQQPQPNQSNSSMLYQFKSGNIHHLEGGFIQPCQLIGKCRLLRANLSQSTGSNNIISQLNICTLGIARLLHTLDVSSSHGYSSMNMSFHESNHVKKSDFINSFVNMDLDHLTSNITRINALGWLDRREFERIWTTYLELLSSASDTNQNVYSTTLEADNTQLISSEELIECSQSIVIGLRGLTRLLMDTSLKPQPGDTLYSRLRHHSRLGTPHFSHTKLGRKLISLLSFIERERDYLNKSSEYATVKNSIHSEYSMNKFNETEDLEMINLERLTDSCITDGPSQFAVDWSIRRLNMRETMNSSTTIRRPLSNEYIRENDKSHSTLKSPISKLNHRTVNNLTLQSYEDPLFSCLQSLQLFYHSCLKPEPFPTRPNNEDMHSLLLGTSKLVDLLTSNPNVISSSVLNKASTAKQAKQINAAPSIKGPAFDVWQSILQSAIILSDLFTTQEQFIWLNDHLQDAVKQLPTWSEFQCPIHAWLALGIAKCTAVLELLNSSPNNSHVLQSNSLEPAVKQTLNTINSSLLTVQNAGLHSSMYLLHAALLIRTQPHQQQLQQHSPPTGSPLLNDLYTQLCSYLEKKLSTIFCTSTTTTNTTNLLSNETSVNQELSLSLMTGSSGMKKLMQAVLHPGAASKISMNSHMERGSSMIHVSNVDLTDHLENHQLIVLSTAFFLTEHFSSPPVYPIVTDSSLGITEMLSGLTANLFRLAPSMLGDTPVVSQSKSPGYTQCSSLSTGTTVDLSYSLSVHMAWCQGIERLIQTGRLGKGAIGSLQKMCINRIRTCRSPHISYLAIRLLLTCMYANLGRLNDRIQHYRRIHNTQSVQISNNNDDDNNTNRNGSNSQDYETKTFQVTTLNENTTGSIAKSESKTDDPNLLESLPSSLLQDSENIAALTQESLNCLWERFRGGISLINSPVQSTHGLQIPWTMSAWTSAVEARLIARLLPLISTDITQTVVGLLTKPETVNKQFSLSSAIIGCDSLPNIVLNKALAEFARADHAFPNLAASNLTELFERFMQNENGQNLIRQWILLSFPTLLSRQPPDLAIWACTVCLLAAATDQKLRAALHLCYTYKLSNSESTNSWYTTNTDRSLHCNPTTNVCLNDLLCISAYHFVTDGLLKPLPVLESESLAAQRQAERNHFLAMLKDHCDAATLDDSCDTTNNHHNNNNSTEHFDKNYSIFHQLYTIVKQQVAITTVVK